MPKWRLATIAIMRNCWILRRGMVASCMALSLTPWSACGPGSERVWLATSEHTYDDVQTVPEREFHRQALVSLFGRFAQEEGHRYRLARLTVSPNRFEAERSLNVVLPEMVPGSLEGLAHNSALLGAAPNGRRVAQVICLGGVATAYIRDGDMVHSESILGSADARTLDLGGLRITMVGFRADKGPRTGLPGSQHESVVVFLRSGILPSLTVAKAIHDYFTDKIGSDTLLVLRTDPFFFPYRGPECDIFEKPWPGHAAAGFLDRPYISCGARGSGVGCSIHTLYPGKSE